MRMRMRTRMTSPPHPLDNHRSVIRLPAPQPWQAVGKERRGAAPARYSIDPTGHSSTTQHLHHWYSALFLFPGVSSFAPMHRRWMNHRERRTP